MPVKEPSSPLEKFRAVAARLNNPSVEQHKSNGGKVAGYFCSVVPEEILIAGGILPFRIRGAMSKTTDMADEYFTSWNCSFPRHCFNLALSGEYGFLDGLVVAGSCDTIRFTYDNWRKSPIKTPFIHLLNVPHVSGEAMTGYFRDELTRFRSALETAFCITIKDEAIWDAIRLCNRTRKLHQALYAFRKQDNSPISGAQIASVMIAAGSLPKEEYNTDLEALLEILSSIPVKSQKPQARMMLVGSGGDDSIIADIVEDLGAMVVNDLTCFGGQIKYEMVPETSGDPLEALATYQIMTKPFCPKIGGAYPLRRDVILNMMREYRADGLIGQRFGCCDPWSGELYTLRDDLKAAGFPSLILEREYIPDSLGQLNTRIQAFIETIRG
jgi:benzoyl-CoA reductase/2-hydroxyglutaryl-CoA dehydratase subunit BcrC/BadD/HgdB